MISDKELDRLFNIGLKCLFAFGLGCFIFGVVITVLLVWRLS